MTIGEDATPALSPDKIDVCLRHWSAMAVTAGVVGDALVATLVALLQMATQRRCTAHFDRAHDAPLRGGQ